MNFTKNKETNKKPNKKTNKKSNKKTNKNMNKNINAKMGLNTNAIVETVEETTQEVEETTQKVEETTQETVEETTQETVEETDKQLETNLDMPFVSVCTPTFNRRPFIPFLIECFQKQDYPKERMEWIIVDDGDDKIEDLVKDIPEVKYYRYENKLGLGKKRNIMNDKCIGDIIVYMDDDDYYPNTRVSHAVETLENNSLYDVVGCDNICVYFGKPEEKTYKIGPYKPFHATAATFAFRKCFLEDHKFDDNRLFGEESSFLNNFTVPLLQLEGDKTIIVFSHSLNTIDKRFIFKNKEHHKVKLVEKEIQNVITNEKYREFVLNNEDYVKDYKYGKLEFKKDIVDKIQEIEDGNKKKIAVIENLKEKLNEHTKEELINVIVNLKIQEHAKNKQISHLQQQQGQKEELQQS